MKTQYWVLLALGAFAFYYFFLRRPVAVVNRTIVPTGAGATSYTGGGVPIAAGTTTLPASSANSTGATLAGVGALLGGVSSLGSTIFSGLGSLGVGSSSGGDSGSYGDVGYGGDDGGDYDESFV